MSSAVDVENQGKSVKRFQLEVCVDSLEGAMIAAASGATRIELSQHLEVGGLTPTSELVTEVCRQIKLPIVVLVRCRPGDFVYTSLEQDRMIDSAIQMLGTGVAGIAVGAADSFGSLHWEFLERMADSCSSMELVVHRVFDGVKRQMEAFEPLKRLGFQRILTSGGPELAIDGIDNLSRWNQSSHGIEILAAGGIRVANAENILQKTGCAQLHGSFSHKQNGVRLPNDEEIKRVREIMDGWFSAEEP